MEQACRARQHEPTATPSLHDAFPSFGRESDIVVHAHARVGLPLWVVDGVRVEVTAELLQLLEFGTGAAFRTTLDGALLLQVLEHLRTRAARCLLRCARARDGAGLLPGHAG